MNEIIIKSFANIEALVPVIVPSVLWQLQGYKAALSLHYWESWAV